MAIILTLVLLPHSRASTVNHSVKDIGLMLDLPVPSGRSWLRQAPWGDKAKLMYHTASLSSDDHSNSSTLLETS